MAADNIERLKKMHRFLFLISLIIFITSTASSAHEVKPYYHSVAAKSGDNVYTFLNRYHLAKADCNITHFYEKNKLKRGAKLIAGKKYFLPVLIYEYNGKSIRTSVGLSSWEPAVRIKKYNQKLKDDKLRRSTLVRSKIIWVPYHELYCVASAPLEKPDIAASHTNVSPNSESPEDKKKKELQKQKEAAARKAIAQEKIDDSVIESSKKLSGYRKFPIFGKKNAYVPLKDNSLRGKVFYVVSGHGGPDVGAVGKRGNMQLCEDEYAYDVSLRLVRNLLEHGAIAYMIVRDPDDGLRNGELLPCDYDEYCWGNFKIPRNQKSRLYQRSDAINTLFERHKKQGIKDQTVVTIHIDSNNQSHQTDVFFYYFPGSKVGKALAVKVRNTLKEKYKNSRKNGKYNGTVKPRDLHMLREPKPTSIFIELGNIRNKFDQTRFIRENNRQALSNWLYEGLVK